MKDCPIPEGYDARRVRPSIERACKEIGNYGPVSITAYGDQKQTLCKHLRGLSSTGAVPCEGFMGPKAILILKMGFQDFLCMFYK